MTFGAVLATQRCPVVTPTAFRPRLRSICAQHPSAGTRIVDPAHGPVDWQDPDLDFAHYSSTGVIGDPTHASAELGARLWEAAVESVADTLRNIALSSPALDDS